MKAKGAKVWAGVSDFATLVETTANQNSSTVFQTYHAIFSSELILVHMSVLSICRLLIYELGLKTR